MKNNRTAALFLFLTLSVLCGSAQQGIDSLRKLIAGNTDDTTKIKHLLNLSAAFNGVGDADSCAFYGNKALVLSKAQRPPWKSGMAAAHLNIGNSLLYNGNYSRALDYYDHALKIWEETGNTVRIAKVLGNIGAVYHYQTDYPKATSYYYKSLKIAEEAKDLKLQAQMLGNLGLVYSVLKQYDKAIDLNKKAFAISRLTGDSSAVAASLANIAGSYHSARDFKKALEAYLAQYRMELRLGLPTDIVTGNIGNTYRELDNFPKAFEYLNKSLELRQKNNDKWGQIYALNELGSTYMGINEFRIAEAHLKRALALADSLGALHERIVTEKGLSDFYFETNDYRNAYLYYKKYTEHKDSAFNDEKNQELTRNELNFEFEKKEALLVAEQREKEAIAKVESKKQRIVIMSVSLGLILVLVLAVVIYKNLVENRKKNKIISEQKQLVEEKQKEMLDSIHYAKRIQRAMITSERYIEKNIVRLTKDA